MAILLILSFDINVITTCSASVFAVAFSGRVVSDNTLLFSSVNNTLSPATNTLFVVVSVFVIVNSVSFRYLLFLQHLSLVT